MRGGDESDSRFDLQKREADCVCVSTVCPFTPFSLRVYERVKDEKLFLFVSCILSFFLFVCFVSCFLL